MSATDDALALWLRSFVAEPRFLARYPLYAGVLARMRPVLDPSTPIMAVSHHDGRFYLLINADYFEKNPRYLLGVLLHEVHHVVLGHLTHPKFRDPAHPDLLEIALEISANEYIEEALPGGIHLRDYEALGLRPHQSTMQRYDRLVELQREQRLKHPSSLSFVDEHRRGDHAPPAAVASLIEGALDDIHENAETTTLRIAGKSPGRLLEQLSSLAGPPARPVDWRTALRMFTAQQRAPRHTYARPNRRFPSRVGEVPGRLYTSRQIQYPELLVVIDTSGSMSQRDLDEVSRQLTSLATSARFQIVECDATIHRVYPFAGQLPDVIGRGGTDLQPPFELDFLRQQRAQGVVYFTDGVGPFPDEPPPVPVLWVLTGDEPFACPWGQQVRM